MLKTDAFRGVGLRMSTIFILLLLALSLEACNRSTTTSYRTGRSASALEDKTDETGNPEFQIFCNQTSDLESIHNVKVLKAELNASSCEELYTKMSALQSLLLIDKSIMDLSFVRFAPLLENLDLRNNDIVEVGPLAQLTKLRFLDLSENRISDLRPIENMVLIEELGVSRNMDLDLRSIASFQKLRTLKASGINLTDLGPLTQLRDLESLSIHSNPFSNLEPLANLKKLKLLDLSLCTNLTNLTPIVGLKNLESLTLKAANVRDLSFVTAFPLLRELRIYEDGIVNTKALLQLPNLRILEIYNEYFEDGDLSTPPVWLPIDYSFLSEMKNLEHLILTDVNLTDLTVLNKLSNLQILKLNVGELGSYVTNPETLAQLSKLKSLSVNYIKSDGVFLESLSQLEELNVGYSALTSFTSVGKLSKLKTLSYENSIGEISITDLSPLTQLKELETLHLKGLNLSEITPIKSMAKLRELRLEGNSLLDLGVLKNLSQLKSLTVAYNSQAISLQSIAGMSSLEELTLQGVAVNFKGIESLTSLRKFASDADSFSDCSLLSASTRLEQLKVKFPLVVDDLGCLKNLSALRKLDLDGSAKLTRIDSLAALSLVSLNIENTAVMDLGSLKNMNLLRELYIQNSPVPSLEPLMGNKRLLQLRMGNTPVFNIQEKRKATCAKVYLNPAISEFCQ